MDQGLSTSYMKTRYLQNNGRFARDKKLKLGSGSGNGPSTIIAHIMIIVSPWLLIPR